MSKWLISAPLLEVLTFKLMGMKTSSVSLAVHIFAIMEKTNSLLLRILDLFYFLICPQNTTTYDNLAIYGSLVNVILN